MYSDDTQVIEAVVICAVQLKIKEDSLIPYLRRIVDMGGNLRSFSQSHSQGESALKAIGGFTLLEDSSFGILSDLLRSKIYRFNHVTLRYCQEISK